MEEFVVEDYSPGPPEEPSGEKCPRCLAPVPARASRCPNCGQPVHALRRMLPLLAGVLLAIGLVLVTVFTYRAVHLANLEKAVPVRTDVDPMPTIGPAPDTSAEHDIQTQTQTPAKPETPAKPDAPAPKPPLNR